MSTTTLLTQTMVYLAATVAGVALAKRMGLSAVLGYLVVGVLIGPSCLRLVGEESGDVMHFAEFGVVLMLFLVGLELRPSLLWRLRGPILELGGAQVLATTTAIMAGAMMLGQGWGAALVLGMALALSSTAIVLQIYREKGLSETAAGRSGFAVLLFQDIAVIPMLAVVPLLATLPKPGGTDAHAEAGSLKEWLAHQPPWVATLAVLVAVCVIVIGGRTILTPVLRAVAATKVREAFVAMALVLVLGIALVMISLGVSPALGTFIAGVVLAESEFRHALESDIEPFKGLLLGVFFLTVGASIDLNLVLAQPMLVLGLVGGLIFVKAAILAMLGRFAKLGRDQGMLLALSLAQGSEFAFVLLGFASEVVPENWTSG